MQHGKLQYIKAIRSSKPITVVTGVAGTGKTFIACQHARKLLKEKAIDRIVVTRPNVNCDEQLGYLPGTYEEKLRPYLLPIFDNFQNYEKYKNLIEIAPLGFMRGRTFENVFVIADEMQNSTPNQMKTLITRLGENSKIVITGDLSQCDLKQENGLTDFLERLGDKNYKYIDTVRLGINDIKRHPLITEILEIYK